MKYTLKGQDIINIYDCLCELNVGNISAENHSNSLQQLRQYLNLFCNTLVKKTKSGETPQPIQLSKKQLQLLDTFLQSYMQDLQKRYEYQEAGKKHLNQIANQLISYNQTYKTISQLAKAA